LITISADKNIQMPKPCILAVGKFESIHLGHRMLIAKMVGLAKSTGLTSALVVFVPHPYRVLSDSGYKPLFTREERARLLEPLGVDYLLEYPFDSDFAKISPKVFCRKLYEDLQAKIVIAGEEDYRFGHNRMGTVDTLKQMANNYNAQVHVAAPHTLLATGKTSTQAIRKLLSENKFLEAESLLGYPFFIMGKVTPGRQLGRTIGIPTINVYPQHDKFLPQDGVYATRTIIDSHSYKGITNVGIRPTVENKKAPRSVETHLLDFNGGELYGKHIHTEFLHFIRPERRFENLDALKAQICEDIKTLH